MLLNYGVTTVPEVPEPKELTSPTLGLETMSPVLVYPASNSISICTHITLHYAIGLVVLPRLVPNTPNVELCGDRKIAVPVVYYTPHGSKNVSPGNGPHIGIIYSYRYLARL